MLWKWPRSMKAWLRGLTARETQRVEPSCSKPRVWEQLLTPVAAVPTCTYVSVWWGIRDCCSSKRDCCFSRPQPLCPQMQKWSPPSQNNGLLPRWKIPWVKQGVGMRMILNMNASMSHFKHLVSALAPHWNHLQGFQNHWCSRTMPRGPDLTCLSCDLGRGSGTLFIFFFSPKLNACIAFPTLSCSLRILFQHYHPTKLSLLSNVFMAILKNCFLEELTVLLLRLCGLKAGS